MFKEYAKYYDYFYKDKTYHKEINYIHKKLIKLDNLRMLDIGCGTGKYTSLLSKYSSKVTGIDTSKSMIKIAKQKYPKTNFICEDINNFYIHRKYDLIICLFDVFSYLKTNKDINLFLKSVNRLLKKNKFFVFDFWFGPGIFNEPPKNKVKKITNKNFSLERKSVILHNKILSKIDVKFEFKIKEKNNIKNFSEIHSMRYFFINEIKYLLEINGFDILNFIDQNSYKNLKDTTWKCMSIAKKL